MKKIFLILLLSPYFTFAQNLRIVNPKTSKNDFTKVQFIGSKGYISAQKFILKTSDNGETWKPIYNYTVGDFDGFEFITEDIGYVKNGHGIFKTEDGGLTWNSIYSETIFNDSYFSFWDTTGGVVMNGEAGMYKLTLKSEYNDIVSKQNTQRSGSYVTGISFLSANEGISIGNQGRINKTTNGYVFVETRFDRNWKKLNSIARFTDNHVLVCGDDGILVKSTDAGNTWEDLEPITHNDLIQILTIDENNAFVIGRANIFRTSNSGESWEEMKRPKGYTFNSIAQNSVGELFIAASSGALLKSIDNGETWMNVTTGRNKNINDLIHLGGSRILSVGNNGTVQVSKDYGHSWEAKIVPTYNNIEAVSASESLVAFVGEYNLVYVSQDYGETWSEIKTESDKTLNQVVVINSKTLIAVGKRGNIWKSSNAGITWNQVGSELTTHELNSVYIGSNGEIGISGEQGTFLLSRDYGETWEDQSEINVKGDLAFITPNLWIQFGSSCYLSVDSGKNWTSSYIGLNNYTGYEIINDSTYLIFETTGNQFKSSDSGKNWTKVISPKQPRAFHSFVRADEKNLVGVTFETLEYSSDSGKTWQVEHYRTDPHINDVDHANENVVFACGNGSILKSIDNGVTWDFSFHASTIFYSIHFFDKNKGIVAGTGGQVFRTEDGGKNWIEEPRIWETPTIYDMDFLDDNNGIMVGNNGKVLRTYDGGETWQSKKFINSSSTLRQVSYVSETNLVAVGGSRDIFFSLDSGETWKAFKIDYFSVSDFKSVDFFNEQVGIAIGSATNYKTTNGGKTWITTGVDHYIPGRGGVEIQCFSETEAYILDDDGAMYKTENQGESWDFIINPSSTDLKAMSYYSSQNIVVVGEFGTILKNEESLITFVDKTYKSQEKLVVFPNPFEDKLNFNIDFDKKGKYNFELYCIQGKIVSHKQIEAGNEIKIQLESQLKPGAYFYKIFSEKKSFTGKLIRK